MELLCPICGGALAPEGKTWRCAAGHCFDVARQGYVHLLPVQNKHSAQPGDTREQVLSRRRFLDGGWYSPIVDTLCRLAQQLGCTGPILDVGCGEGYYSTRLAQALDARLIGLDISKEAVRCAAGQYKGPLWLCASAARLPVAASSVGLLTSLFALTLPEEFHRVLKKDGVFLQVLAAQDHLLGLKQIIYPQLKHKIKDPAPQLPGFRLEQSVPLRFSFTVEGQAVEDLLSMTPHVYRINKEGAQRLRQTQTLTDTASVIFNIYRPL